jgi:preprotein translocase subunit SecA
MIPFDVQLVGAMTLNGGNIPEMRTGEGKTLVATIAAYLNALSGEPVHVVTVNEYLSRRDASEMSIIYGTLGLTTGVVLNSQNREEKKKNYNCDIVYVTNTELGFDYLRDNMATSLSDQVMSRRSFAIIDEVDSILVDEARTPLIISSPDNEPTSKYLKFAQMSDKLSHPEHYTVDEKTKTVALTEEGIERVEKFL